MTTTKRRLRRCSPIVLAASGGLIAAVSASATGAGPEGAESRVVRVRRGEAPSGAAVSAVRRATSVPTVEPQGRVAPAGESGGSMVALTDGGPELTTVPDSKPESAGLPDATEGGPVVATSDEVVQLQDIGVYIKREGRRVSVVGAEFVFSDIAMHIDSGVGIGFTGVRGRMGQAAGATRFVEFTLDAGGALVLTVQPQATSPSAPLRPVRLVTMQIP